MRRLFSTGGLTRAAIIAALYVVVTFMLRPVSFGPLQFRLSEALTLIPMLFLEAVPGLYVGVLVANILGGLGPWDIFAGSAVTLLAAYITYRFRWTPVAYASPIILNGFLVSAYLAPIYGWPYWTTAASLLASEAVVVLAFGIPLVLILRRSGLGSERKPGFIEEPSEADMEERT